MAATIQLVYRKDKINNKDIAPVCVRFIKDRKVCYISTGIKLEKKYWDFKLNKVKPNYPTSSRTNNLLTKMLFEYEERALVEQTQNLKINTKYLKEKVTSSSKTTFFEVAEQVLGQYLAKNSFGTYDKCRSIVTKLKEYGCTTNLTFSEITTQYLAKYEKYLREEKGNMTNTVHKDFRFIRRVFNEAYKLGYIEHNESPFLKYKLSTEKTNRKFLSSQELNRIECLELGKSSRMALHRDMFVFSAYTGGIRVSDTLLLKWSDFSGTHINFSIQKTGVQHSIKVPEKALTILDAYKPFKSGNNSFIFPMLPAELDLKDYKSVDSAISSATAYINKNLKIIAKLAEIEKNLSFHIARHTWATLALGKGVSLDKVSKLMGHASVKETEIYAKIVNEQLDKAMDEFNK